MMRLAPRWWCSRKDMNDKLFGGVNSVGKTIRLDNAALHGERRAG